MPRGGAQSKFSCCVRGRVYTCLVVVEGSFKYTVQLAIFVLA